MELVDLSDHIEPPTWDLIHESVETLVCLLVWETIWNSVEDSVHDSVLDSTWETVYDQLIPKSLR